MAKRGHVWAIGYDHMERAAQVRDEVIRLGERHCLVVLDTAIVERYSDGGVTLNGQRFFPGIDMGLFIGLALGAPLMTAPVVGALLRSARPASDEVHIDERFVAGVEGLLKPGTSALFVLDHEGDMDGLLQEI